MLSYLVLQGWRFKVQVPYSAFFGMSGSEATIFSGVFCWSRAVIVYNLPLSWSFGQREQAFQEAFLVCVWWCLWIASFFSLQSGDESPISRPFLPHRELDWCVVGHVDIYVLVFPKGELIINVFSWHILLLEKQLNIHAVDVL